MDSWHFAVSVCFCEQTDSSGIYHSMFTSCSSTSLSKGRQDVARPFFAFAIRSAIYAGTLVRPKSDEYISKAHLETSWPRPLCQWLVRVHAKHFFCASRAAPVVLQSLRQLLFKSAGHPRFPSPDAHHVPRVCMNVPCSLSAVGYKRSRQLPCLFTTKTRFTLGCQVFTHTQQLGGSRLGPLRNLRG